MTLRLYYELENWRLLGRQIIGRAQELASRHQNRLDQVERSRLEIA